MEGVKLIGRIDGAYKTKNELWLFESKTKSRIEEESLTDALAFDFQTNLYQYVLQKKYDKVPTGVLYNVVRRPGEKIKKEGSVKELFDRVRSKVVADPSYYFLRYEISVPLSESRRFEVELKQVLSEFVKWWKKELPTYRNTSACLQRFGPCRFLPLCANGDRGLYTKREHLFPELVDK